MNNKQITCDPTRIELFLSQQLDDWEQAAFELHLDDCGDCRQQLEEAAASEEIWSGVRNSLQDQKLSTDYMQSEDSANNSTSGGDASFNLDAVINLLSPTDDDRMIGRLGSYEVLGVIGSGGMGVVLKAFDAALNRYVAIKILSPHLGSSGAARKRFSREAQAAAAVVHDNVIEIYGVSDVNGLPYLVMPYVRDPSLQRRLDNAGPLALVEVLRVGMQTAAGLAAAHAQGLVHRDVKPANILLADGVERVKLADFGLARAADDASLTMTGIIAGTPQYMSPEQARGDSVDQRSDLFSLGSVLYAMATGRMPFRAETSYGVLRRITDQEPKPIREINPDIPEWLCDIITKLMSKQPDDRFESASEVGELLEKCLAHVQQPTVVPLPKEVCSNAVSSKNSERRFPLAKVLWGTAFAFIVFFAGLLISLELNKGTLTIECEADDIPVRITQGDTLVKELTVTKEGKKVRIAAGTYMIEIDGKFDGISIAKGTINLKRGETEVVRIVKKEDISQVSQKPIDGLLISDAVRLFNLQQQQDPIGRTQPLLTDDELIASVRVAQYLLLPDYKKRFRKEEFDTINNSRLLPAGWSIEKRTGLESKEGAKWTIWAVDLKIVRRDGTGFTHTIRDRTIDYQAAPRHQKINDSLEADSDWIPLTELIVEFNKSTKEKRGNQPLITVEEIVAHLFRILNSIQDPQRLESTHMKAITVIAATRAVPLGTKLEPFLGFETNLYKLKLWQVQLKLPSGVSDFGIPFRSTTLGSSLLDRLHDHEIAWGPPAEDGLQAGVHLTKSDDHLTAGVKYMTTFYFRNQKTPSVYTVRHPIAFEIDARTPTGDKLEVTRSPHLASIGTGKALIDVKDQDRAKAVGYAFVISTSKKDRFDTSPFKSSVNPENPIAVIHAPRDQPVRLNFRFPFFKNNNRNGIPVVTGQVSLNPQPEKTAKVTLYNKREYTCPMHPQIHQKKPGRCAICEMELAIVDPLIGEWRLVEVKPENIPFKTLPNSVDVVIAFDGKKMISKNPIDDGRYSTSYELFPENIIRFAITNNKSNITTRPKSRYELIDHNNLWIAIANPPRLMVPSGARPDASEKNVVYQRFVRVEKTPNATPETVTLKPAKIPPASTKPTELEGTWKIIAAPTAGTLGFHPIIKSVIVTGNIWTYQKHGRVSSFYRELILDSNSSPKKIDWIYPGRLGKSMPARGLYRLKGDMLEIAINKNSEYIRPKSFDAPNTVIQTWERVPDGAKEKLIKPLKSNLAGSSKETSTSAIIWDKLGLKLEAVSLEKLPSKKYRGGMKILALRPNSPTTKAGIRVEDILVGLNIWETTSFENLSFVMDQLEDQPEKKDSRDVKFYVLRGEETLFGNLEIPIAQKIKMPSIGDSSEKLTPIKLAQATLSKNGIVLEGKLEPNTEIVLQIAKSAHSKKMEWTSRLKAGGPVTVSVTRSDKIKLDDNQTGRGVVFATEVNGLRDRVNIAMTEKGSIPYGPILFKSFNPTDSTTTGILQKESSFHFADIILKDGSLVPISILFRIKESDDDFSFQLKRPTTPSEKKEPGSAGFSDLQLKPAKPTLSIQEAADLHDAIMSLKEEIRGCEKVLKKSPEEQLSRTLLKKARSRLAFYHKGLATKFLLLELDLKDAESASASPAQQLELKKRHYETGFTPRSEVLKAQRDVEAAKLRVEHSRTLLKLYHDIDPPEQNKSQLWNEYGVTPAPVSPITAKVLEWIGLNLSPITKKQFRGKDVLAKQEGGLDITFTRTGGPAEKAGIYGGIIVAVQGQAVTNLENLDLAIQGIIEKNKNKETASISFDVLRNGKTVTL